MKLAESGENYLENIYILQKKLGMVRSIDLAREMDFSKPSVSRAIHALEKQGLLVMEENGNLQLTEKGERIAADIYERHVFLSNYLIAIGVDEEIAAMDACRIEHVISKESFERMKAHIHHCARECPKAANERFIKFNKEMMEELVEQE